MPTQEEKTQALLMWILSLFIGFISPLIFVLISKEKPFVYQNSAYALGFCIVLTIAWIIAFVLMFVVIGIFLMPLIGIAGLVVAILGAVKANNGEVYIPPMSGGIAKAIFKDLP